MIKLTKPDILDLERAITGCAIHPSDAVPFAEAVENIVQYSSLAWAVAKWRDEVQNRPLVNVNRRALDDTWRQVIRYFGGDPVLLCGPAHDDLLITLGKGGFKMKLVLDGRYNWKNQKERLIYVGLRRGWHCFAKVETPHMIWCEVLEQDLHMLQETKP